MHTQSIMQNALIKKKLEEQRENFRKRQDQQQQQQQVQQQQQLRASSPVINSPAKQTASPLAFTPTSVLRKMTADKEPDGANQFRKLETTSSIIPAINGNINRMSRDQNNHRVHTAVPSVDSSKFSNSVNQVQNETLKMIFLQSAIANHMNNNTCSTEESALKTKYSCSLQQEKDIKDNPDINTTKENVFLDVNENANDNAKVSESNVIDVDNDTNNNDCVSFDEAVKKSSDLETLVDENNQMIVFTASDGIGNVNS